MCMSHWLDFEQFENIICVLFAVRNPTPKTTVLKKSLSKWKNEWMSTWFNTWKPDWLAVSGFMSFIPLIWCFHIFPYFRSQKRFWSCKNESKFPTDEKRYVRELSYKYLWIYKWVVRRIFTKTCSVNSKTKQSLYNCRASEKATTGPAWRCNHGQRKKVLLECSGRGGNGVD